MTFDRLRPYNDLPLLPPDVELETRTVLKHAISSNKALAELKGMVGQVPNPNILLDGIVLQEARSSSEIENIVTTNDELYRAAADPSGKTDPQTKEVLRYREALWNGLATMRDRPLSTNTFIEIVRIIRQSDIGIRKTPGTVLRNQEGETVYTPPEGEGIIREKLANLERFIHSDDDLDPLVRLAVAHYQFEAIHPFSDGNGRTGRIVNVLYLVNRGLLDQPVLFLSHYIVSHRGEYYSGLRAVTEQGAWEEWILFMLRAIEETSRQTCNKITRILALMENVRQIVQAKEPRIYSKDLVETVFLHPYCKIRFLEEAGIAKRQTASEYLKALSTMGVLQPRKAGRDIYYVNGVLLKVLTEE